MVDVADAEIVTVRFRVNRLNGHDLDQQTAMAFANVHMVSFEVCLVITESCSEPAGELMRHVIPVRDIMAVETDKHADVGDEATTPNEPLTRWVRSATRGLVRFAPQQ